MKRVLLITLILSASASVSAQYPFDKFSKPVFKSYSNWKTIENRDEKKTHLTLTIPKFFADSSDCTLQFTVDNSGKERKNILRIYKGKKAIQRFNYEQADYYPEFVSTLPFKVADLNGDSLLDIKITYDYHSNGMNLSFRPIYLIQNQSGFFTKYSFNNKFEDRIDFERDFDNDGAFEIQSVQMIHSKGHNYWCFTVFKITNTGLVNISNSVGYPMFIQFLTKRNYKQTNVELTKDEASSELPLDILTDNGVELK